MGRTKLEKEISEMKRQMSDLNKKFDELMSKNIVAKQKTDSHSVEYVPASINPWALRAVSEIRAIMDNDVRTMSASMSNSRGSMKSYDEQQRAKVFEVFKPILEALTETKKGKTAEEISKITGRRRNTESAYLNRLQLAGIVKRKKVGRKIEYELVDKTLPQRIFAE